MEDKPFESMNMIPFIDIMLVLLTIVLMTSSFIASGKIPVQLPQTQNSVAEQDKSRLIEIDAQGTIYWEGRTVTAQALSGMLEGLPKDTAFLLRADREVSLQRFVDVADVLKQSGFSKVAVQTQSAP